MVEQVQREDTNTQNWMNNWLKGVSVKKLPNWNVTHLQQKILKASTGILELVGQWRMEFISPEVLSGLWKRKWKNQASSNSWMSPMTGEMEVLPTQNEIQIMSDLSEENFQNRNIHGYIFFLKNPKTWIDEVVAMIYMVNWVEKILLLSNFSGYTLFTDNLYTRIQRKREKMIKKWTEFVKH